MNSNVAPSLTHVKTRKENVLKCPPFATRTYNRNPIPNPRYEQNTGKRKVQGKKTGEKYKTEDISEDH